MVHGEQLEPLGSALSSRPQYIVVSVGWLKSRLYLRALHREQLETWGSALYLESSSSFWTPWLTESRRRAARTFRLRALLSTAIHRGSGSVVKVTSGSRLGAPRSISRAARASRLRRLLVDGE